MSTASFLLKSKQGDLQIAIDGELIAGRDDSCGIVLSQGQASRQHAKLSPSAKGIMIEDLKSTNGTFVNGKKITEPTLMAVGDELRIGKIKFSLEAIDLEQTAVDADATMLFTGSAEDDSEKEKAPLAKTVDESKKKTPKPEKEDLSDSQAPPSWVLNNQQAVDGTKFLSKDAMKDALKSSSGSGSGVQENVNVPTLVGSCDPIMGIRFQLSGKGQSQWEIGRATSNNVMINHDSVSSNHAQIICEGARWKITDLMSANGTYVNGKKGLSSYLSSGDVLRFGEVECTFSLPKSSFNKSATDPSVEIVVEKQGSSTVKTALLAFAITGVLAVAVIFGLSLWL